MFFSSVLSLWDKPRLDPVVLLGLHAFARCLFLAQVSSVACMGAPKGPQKSVCNRCCSKKPLALWERAASQDCANDYLQCWKHSLVLHSGTPGAFGDAAGLPAVCSQENTT